MDSSGISPYQPLEQSERHFRLLRLRQSDTCQTQCEMKTFSFLNDDLPTWIALSYRWGDDEPAFMVYLNDHPVPVRKGLHAFLAQMKTENRHDWYFIDALCIDQSNDLEKSYQVLHMREIYQQAEEVVIWMVYEPYHYEFDGVLQAVYHPDEDGKDISSLSRAQLEDAVLENSYWSRLWILQEVLLAKKLTIRIGSAEVEWSSLLPEKASSEGRAPPTRNDNIDDSSVWQNYTVPYANKVTAYNILRYRRFRTKALRAGYHLPFHKAVDFFSTQRCSRPHDAVFGYLGLTNSRIRIDYSTPILDLFVATLADYLVSAGFIRQGLTWYQFRWRIYRLDKANEMISPLLAFRLDPFEPVVHLLLLGVTKFFTPGFGEELADRIRSSCWAGKRYATRAQGWMRSLQSEHKFQFRYIGSLCVMALKFAASEKKASEAVEKDLSTRLKELETADAVMSAPGGSGESKTYSQWAAHARAISEQIWQRFMESGEDAEGDMDDESWTLNS